MGVRVNPSHGGGLSPLVKQEFHTPTMQTKKTNYGSTNCDRLQEKVPFPAKFENCVFYIVQLRIARSSQLCNRYLCTPFRSEVIV